MSQNVLLVITSAPKTIMYTLHEKSYGTSLNKKRNASYGVRKGGNGPRKNGEHIFIQMSVRLRLVLEGNAKWCVGNLVLTSHTKADTYNQHPDQADSQYNSGQKLHMVIIHLYLLYVIVQRLSAHVKATN